MDRSHYEIDAEYAQTHWWYRARRTLLDRLLHQSLRGSSKKLPNHLDILEIGCSTGSNIPMLRRYGDVQALEMDHGAAELARSRNPGVLIDVGSIPMPIGRRFDLICAFDVLEHIEDDIEVLRWIESALSSHGSFALTVPAMPFLWSDHDVQAHHFRRYTKQTLLSVLKDNFEIIKLTYFNTHLFPAIAATRALQRLGVIPEFESKTAGSHSGLSSVLETVFAAERFWIPYLSAPFGVSLFALVKPKAKIAKSVY